jgi:hypothetical protein
MRKQEIDFPKLLEERRSRYTLPISHEKHSKSKKSKKLTGSVESIKSLMHVMMGVVIMATIAPIMFDALGTYYKNEESKSLANQRDESIINGVGLE